MSAPAISSEITVGIERKEGRKKQRKIETDKERKKQTKTERQKDRKTERQKDRQKDRKKETNKQTKKTTFKNRNSKREEKQMLEVIKKSAFDFGISEGQISAFTVTMDTQYPLWHL